MPTVILKENELGETSKRGVVFRLVIEPVHSEGSECGAASLRLT